MDTYSCPHCKQEIEAQELGADAAKQCPYCGKTLQKKDATERKMQKLAKLSSFLGTVTYIYLAVILLLIFVSHSPSSHTLIYLLPIFPVGAVCVGHFVLFQLRKNPDTKDIKTLARKGLLLGYLFFVLIMVAVPYFMLLRIYGISVGCQINLQSINLHFYDSQKRLRVYPPLSSEKGRLFMAGEEAGFHTILCVCPADSRISRRDRKRLGNYPGDHKDEDNKYFKKQEFIKKPSYFYLGYVITNDTEMKAFVEVYKKRIAQGLPFDTDLDVAPGTGTGGGDKILRMRAKEELECIFKENNLDTIDINSIPVMWDRCVWPPDQEQPTLNHKCISHGIFVLYTDGTVYLTKLGANRWPLTEETMRLLWELENL